MRSCLGKRNSFNTTLSTLAVAAAASILSGVMSIEAGAEMPTSQFLLVGEGARAEAMGESVVADCGDATATYWNPAAMSFARNPEIGLNSVTLSYNLIANNASFVLPGRKFSFGFRLITLNSTIDNYDTNGNRLPQNLSENDLNYEILASYRLDEYISLGLGWGSTTMNLSVPGVTYSATAGNVNCGAMYTRDSLSLGASISNLGGEMKFTNDSPGEPQPMAIRVGGAYKLLDDKNLTIATAWESNIYDNNAGGFRAGSEYAFNENFALRGGLVLEKYGDPKPTIGFGVCYFGFSLDYSATITTGDLSDMMVSRIGLSYKFGGGRV